MFKQFQSLYFSCEFYVENFTVMLKRFLKYPNTGAGLVSCKQLQTEIFTASRKGVLICGHFQLAHATHWAQLTTRVATFTRESAHVSVT